MKPDIVCSDSLPTFDEKMKAGASMEDGLGGAMTIRDEKFPTFSQEFVGRQNVHKPTRSV